MKVKELEQEINKKLQEVEEGEEYKRDYLKLVLKGFLEWEIKGNDEQKLALVKYKQVIINALNKLESGKK
jgi:hypothetical protein